MRINKFLSQAGVCSRREADRLISEGRVSVDGKIANLGDDVDSSNLILVNGNPIDGKDANRQRVVLIYNKPEGLICSSSNKDGPTVFDKIDYPKRLFYAGRLDKASRGLLILTNDGELSDSLMKGKNGHEREYEVLVDTLVSDEVLEAFRKGVFLRDLNVKTKPCTVKRISEREFSITLKQGLNRQIRRMCETFGLHVQDLCRVRIEGIHLGRLKEGTYRKLSQEEKEGLLATIDNGRKNRN